jgi:hypothetical protein
MAWAHVDDFHVQTPMQIFTIFVIILSSGGSIDVASVL